MRNMTKVLMALGVSLVFIPGSDLMAQRRRGLVDISHRNDRHGFWVNLGVGAGSENFRYTNDAGCGGTVGAWQCDNNVKPTFTLGMGGTVSRNFRLGGEIHGWVWEHRDNVSDDRVTSYLVGGLLTGQFYPLGNAGLFVKGGLGISRSGEDFQYIGSAGETGFAYLVGAGYEVKLSRSIFLTPVVSMMRHVSTDPSDVDNLGTFHERLFTVGVGLTIQPGR